MVDQRARVIGDRYVLCRRLARGGMGVVWEAEDRLLERVVAVKEVVLPATTPGERDAIDRRALREARTAARLNHPGVVTVYDVVQEDGNAFIVMEMVRAPTLAEEVRDHGPMSPARTAELGLQLLDVLEAAHAVGVVHRDVKPANVLLPGGRAKLTDFGIARLRDDSNLTMTGRVMGSPSYLSPEQATGKPSGPPTDLWALGATMYFAVEGVAPFERGAALATMAAVVNDPPRPPIRAGALEPLLLGLLGKDPDLRPQPREVARELRRAAPPVESPTQRLETLSDGDTTVPGRRVVAPSDRSPEPAPSSRAAGAVAGALAGAVVAGASRPWDAAASVRSGAAVAEPAPGDRPSQFDDGGVAAGATANARPPRGSRSGGRTAAPIAPHRRRIGGTIALLALALAIMVTLFIVSRHYVGRSTSGNPPAVASGPATTKPPRTTARPPVTTTPPKTSRPSTTTSRPATTAPRTTVATSPVAGAPAGWTGYSNPVAGYTVAYPASWRRRHISSTVTQFTDPATGAYLRVDWTDHPKDPVTAWQVQAANFAATHVGYRQLQLGPTTFHGHEGAVWEYLYDARGTTMHGIDITFVDQPHAYAFNFQTRASDWASSSGVLSQLEAGFVTNG